MQVERMLDRLANCKAKRWFRNFLAWQVLINLLRAHPWCIYELLSLITAQEESRVWAAYGIALSRSAITWSSTVL
jgi:hypothetical protein